MTPDLHGLLPVDEEVASGGPECAVPRIPQPRSKGRNGQSRLSEVKDIVRVHARWSPWSRFRRTSCQAGASDFRSDLVRDIDQGPHGDREGRRPQRGAALGPVRQRAEFMASHDLLVLPTVAVPPSPVEQPYPTEINGKTLDDYTEWFYLTYGITLTGLPAISSAMRFHGVRLAAGRAAARRASPAGRRRPTAAAASRGGGAPGRTAFLL